jgi:hypothetical protein
MIKRIIESTDLWIAVNQNGDAHIFAGDEPTLEDEGVFCGMLLAYLGPSRLYGLDQGECVRLLFESKVKADHSSPSK